jgi:hypothetical protein
MLRAERVEGGEFVSYRERGNGEASEEVKSALKLLRHKFGARIFCMFPTRSPVLD